METKVCKECKRELPLSSFHLLTPKNRPKTYYRGVCIECFNKKEKVRHKIKYNKIKDTPEFKNKLKQKHKDNMKNPEYVEARRKRARIYYSNVVKDDLFKQKRYLYFRKYTENNRKLINSKKKTKYWLNKIDIGVIHIEDIIDERTALSMFETVYSEYHTIIDSTGKEYFYADLIT